MNKDEIKEWLDSHKIKNYTINDDLTVDVNGSVSLFWRHLDCIPVQFGNVTGDFWCSKNNLKSLKGAPSSVGGHFECWCNKLESLDYLPKTIKGDFDGDDYLKDTKEYKRYLFLKSLNE